MPDRRSEKPEKPALCALAERTLLFAVLLGAEALIASLYLDGDSLLGKPGVLVSLLQRFGAWALRFVIGFSALFVTFAWLKHKETLIALAGKIPYAPISRKALAVHTIVLPIFAGLSWVLYGSTPAPVPADLIAAAWFLFAAALALSAALAFLPRLLWIELQHVTGHLWILASVAALAACILGAYSRILWPPATRLTFNMVRLILQPFFRNLVVQPERMHIGTPNFTAIISEECSGLEGASLLLIFGVLWLVLFRRDSRFPQSLLLLPIAILLLFLLNSVRIAALIAIGHSGARDVAAKGFHSQAGWITFNFVAFAFSGAARRSSWFSKRAADVVPAARETYNPAAAYLVPFLAILAAHMLSRSISGNFEWTYALGFLACASTLWVFRERYTELSWRFGWPAVLSGLFVFIVWVAFDRFTGAARQPMPGPLADAPLALRDSWIALRALSAIATVPIAEELAFRGFLQRRLVAEDFETLPFQRWTWLSLVLTSVAFGVMHGERWLAGIIAGLVYGALAIRTGRLGDAVAAHATTNAILAAYVLLFGHWQFW